MTETDEAIPPHPLALLMPPMSEEEDGDLGDSIEREGLREPGVRHEGKLLDGIHRQNKCRERGVPFRVREFDPATEGSPLDFVVAKNMCRRHLTQSQRAWIASAIGTVGQGARTDLRPEAALPKVTQRQAARRAGAGERLTRSANLVRARGLPKLGEPISRAHLCVTTAEPLAANFTIDEQAALFEKAEQIAAKRRWPLGRAVKYVTDSALRTAENENRFRRLPRDLGNQIFAAGLTDPPWPVEGVPYDTMTMDEIRDFRPGGRAVRDIMAPDALIGMCALDQNLFEVEQRVLPAWGFEPKARIIWDKEKFTPFNPWVRGQHEYLIIATRGNVRPPPSDAVPASIYREMRTDHSRKPAAFRKIIEAMASGMGPPRLELFGRGVEPPGWVFYGNQAVDKDESEEAA